MSRLPAYGRLSIYSSENGPPAGPIHANDVQRLLVEVGAFGGDECDLLSIRRPDGGRARPVERTYSAAMSGDVEQIAPSRSVSVHDRQRPACVRREAGAAHVREAFS